jgi:hypothetical protein
MTVDVPAAYGFDHASDALDGGRVRLARGRLTLTVPGGGYRVIDLR